MSQRGLPEIRRGTPLGLPTDKDLPFDDAGGEAGALRTMPGGEDLPYDDGEPMETPWHRDTMNLLIDSLKVHWRLRHDYFVGGNMFVYFSNEQAFDKDFRGPDFFVVKDVPLNHHRVSWVSWKEGGRLPDVIIELLSPTTAAIDRGEKKRLYANIFRTANYFCYDPATDKLEGWRHEVGTGYVALAPDLLGRIWSQPLGLFVGPWDGLYQDTQARWLRFFTPEDKLVLTALETETAARAAAEAKVNAAEAKVNAARAEANAARAEANAAEAKANTAETKANTEAAARATAESRANAEAAAHAAAERELERLEQQLAAHRNPPPTTP